MNLKQWLAIGAAAGMLAAVPFQAAAQNDAPPPPAGGGGGGGRRGNFDPAQFRQQMMERIREQMEITKDDEWTAIEPLVSKVMEARRDAGGFGGFGGRRGGPGGPGGPGGTPDANAQGRRRGGFGAPSPEAEALQKVLEAKSTDEQVKMALQKFRAARKVKQEALDKARKELQAVLTIRQEAVAVENGLLD